MCYVLAWGIIYWLPIPISNPLIILLYYVLTSARHIPHKGNLGINLYYHLGILFVLLLYRTSLTVPESHFFFKDYSIVLSKYPKKGCMVDKIFEILQTSVPWRCCVTSVPDHYNKVNIAIKWVKWIFGFPSVYKTYICNILLLLLSMK